VAFSPIGEFASSRVADPATGLFHDADRCVTTCGFLPTQVTLALVVDTEMSEVTHGFRPCVSCFRSPQFQADDEGRRD
jgi:hypothetical protein